MKKLIFTCSTLFLLLGCVNNQAVSSQQKADQVQLHETTVKLKDELLAGSGSNLAITQQLIEAYEKKSGTRIELPRSIGSEGAIKAVKAGDLSIGLISRPLKENEKEAGLIQMPYAQLGIVVGVNTSVPDENITGEDLVDIFEGKKTTWNNGEMIIVLSREKGDSNNVVLEKMVTGFKEVLRESLEERRWEVLFTDQETADAINNTPNSIGLTDTGVINISHPDIKPLKIDDIKPTTENISNGTYKWVKTLYFVYKEGKVPQWGQDFIEFVYSSEGKQVISQSGIIPLKKVSQRNVY